MNNYRFEIVTRKEATTGNDLECLHVILSSNSNVDIADTYIPFDEIQTAIKDARKQARQGDIEARRTQGALDGWEIRRAKQKNTPPSGDSPTKK